FIFTARSPAPAFRLRWLMKRKIALHKLASSFRATPSTPSSPTQFAASSRAPSAYPPPRPWSCHMSNDVTFVHLTDLHIGDHTTDDHLFSDTAQTLRAIMAQVATIEPKPSFIVASGDLTNAGDAESYVLLRE